MSANQVPWYSYVYAGTCILSRHCCDMAPGVVLRHVLYYYRNINSKNSHAKLYYLQRLRAYTIIYIIYLYCCESLFSFLQVSQRTKIRKWIKANSSCRVGEKQILRYAVLSSLSAFLFFPVCRGVAPFRMEA